MDERAVRAALARIEHEARGLYMNGSESCQLVPVAAIAELIAAVDDEPAKPAPTGYQWPDPDARPTY